MKDNGYLGENLTESEIKDLQNKSLVRQIQNGDKAAADELCRRNMPFVVKVAKKFEGYMGSDLSLDDLIQEGMIGLLKAAENADTDRPEVFLTYAGFWIESKIRRANTDQGFAIRIPANVMNDILTLSKADTLFSHLERKERIHSISKHLNWSKERIIDIFKASELHNIKRADKPLSDDGTLRLKDFFTYEIIPDIADEVINEILRNKIRNRIATLTTLTDQEKIVAVRRFYLGDTLEKIGDILGVSRERTRQIEYKLLRKLRVQRVQIAKDIAYKEGDQWVIVFDNYDTLLKERKRKL